MNVNNLKWVHLRDVVPVSILAYFHDKVHFRCPPPECLCLPITAVTADSLLDWLEAYEDEMDARDVKVAARTLEKCKAQKIAIVIFG